MEPLPFKVECLLEGWTLFWALLELQPEVSEFPAEVRRDVVAQIRRSLEVETLSLKPAVAGLRKLFKAAGCDPSRYRPSSEALLRRLLKGEEMPVIHPLVDLNNCLSALLAVPCCVMVEEALRPPFVFRRGMPGENFESLRGPFNLEDKPVLADRLGACDAPITGGVRVKVVQGVQRVWLVAYLPAEAVTAQSTEAELRWLVQSAPVVKIHLAAATY